MCFKMLKILTLKKILCFILFEKFFYIVSVINKQKV